MVFTCRKQSSVDLSTHGRLAADVSEMEEASFPGTDRWHIYCIKKAERFVIR